MNASVTLSTSFSFYVRETKPALIARAVRFGDAITIAGPKGPDVYRRADENVRMKPVIFDGEGYRGGELDPATWSNLQRSVGADRVLLPGVFVDWARNDDAVLAETVRSQASIAADHDATLLLALDSKWLANRTELLIDVLCSAGRPSALVLAHRDDPLGSAQAVAGLRSVCSKVPNLSLLRSDHGAVGGVAHGAVHASIGLASSTRHFAPPSFHPQTFGDRSARLFLISLINWYRASEVAGWITGGAPLSCMLPCCEGGRLERYLDPHVDATEHNLQSLAYFADYILNADPLERSALFLETCREAVGRYGTAGFRGPTNPKAQLSAWALA
jgi:hypothetical protein